MRPILEHDIRTPRIITTLQHLEARATGQHSDGLLPRQTRPLDSNLARAFFQSLLEESMAQGIEISDAAVSSFKDTVYGIMGSAVNYLNRRCSPGVELSIQRAVVGTAVDWVIRNVKEQNALEAQHGREYAASRGIRGEMTYRKYRHLGLHRGMQLDAEALGIMLQNVELPKTSAGADLVGHYEAPYSGGSKINDRDISVIQDIFRDNPSMRFVIVNKEAGNYHWHGNVYEKAADGGVKPILDSDYSYVQGSNTCGISAAAHGLQIIQEKMPAYYSSPLPGPRATAEELMTAADRILKKAPLPESQKREAEAYARTHSLRTVKAPVSTPRAVKARTKPVVKKEPTVKELTHTLNTQVTTLESCPYYKQQVNYYKRQAATAGQPVFKDLTQQYIDEAPELLDDYKMALKLQAEEFAKAPTTPRSRF